MIMWSSASRQTHESQRRSALLALGTPSTARNALIASTVPRCSTKRPASGSSA